MFLKTTMEFLKKKLKGEIDISTIMIEYFNSHKGYDLGHT